MKFVVVALYIACLVSATLGFGTGLSSTVFSLSAYQTENGGFHSMKFEGVPANAAETHNALFLASLFGVKDKIYLDGVNSFLASLETQDHGFSQMPGQPSDLESIWNVLSAHAHLESLPAAPSDLINLVLSLYDDSAKLFRNSPTKAADYRATARAFEIFQLLGHDDAHLKQIKEAVATKLNTVVKRDDARTYFSLITADNFFAIEAASLAGFKFSDSASWIRYFTQRQVVTGNKQGGFYSDNTDKDAKASDLDYAIHAIYILKGNKLVTKTDVNLPALIGYVSSLQRGLDASAHAYSALARTTAFQELFKITPSYAVHDSKFKITGSRIIQGTLFKPSLQVKTTFALTHPGLTASVVISHNGEEDTYQLEFDHSTQMYEAHEFYDTNGKLGEIVLTYKLKWDVAGFDTLSFEIVERKSVGFDLVVNAKASVHGKEVAPHGLVGVGTSFSFDVRLGTVAVPRPKLLSGDFVVALSVYDSSNVRIHTSTLDGKENTKPFAFEYLLSSTNLPAGRLTFRFQVGNAAGAHTTEDVWYNLQASMVASDISFASGQEFNFGETFKITMEPATLSDSTLQKYTNGARQFFLDIYSESRAPLLSYAGVPDESGKYAFSVTIPARFDVIGNNIIVFRYRDASGNDIQLQNYDSEANALFEDPLKFRINADLELVGLEGAPHAGDLEYGNEISFSFNIKDTKSGEFVYRGSADAAAYLVLRHKAADGSSFVSTKTRAFVETDKTGAPSLLFINWAVDPNAVKDAGQLQLVAQDANGNEIPLRFEGKPWSVDVNVGGNLNIEHSANSQEFDDFDTSFLVSFDLTSSGKKLTGAQLTARVTFAKGSQRKVIAILPVASSVDGSYQVSWTLPTDAASSGEYVVDVYRKVDLSRSQSEDVYEGAKPFFSIHHQHEGRVVSPLPFKTEFLVLLVLIVSLVAVSMKKLEIERAGK